VTNSQWTGRAKRETCPLCARPIAKQVTIILKPRALLQSVTAVVVCQCGAGVPWSLTHSGEG
jgi:hypothetical protein